MGMIMQQLRSQCLLKNLFMVEARVIEGGEALINVDKNLNKNIMQCSEKTNGINETCKLKKKRNELWDVIGHQQMVEEVQALVDAKNRIDNSGIDSDQEDAKNMEIWGDNMSMSMLNDSQLPIECEEVEKVKMSKCIMHYYQSNDNLMFKDLVVHRPNER